MAVDGPQPPSGPGEEGERRHQHQPETDIQAAHAGADQPHIVIERQPGDEDVRRGDARGLLHCLEVGQQVGVGQRHALGVAGAAGGVLQESDVLRGQGWQRQRAGAGQLDDGCKPAQQGALRSQQVAERPGPLVGDKHDGLGIGEDAGDAPHVILDLRRTRRRIQRRRHTPGVERAVEGGEKFTPGGQHDGDPVPRS